MKTIFTPQQYNIADERQKPFIDPDEIRTILAEHTAPSAQEVDKTIERAMDKQRLSLHETAILINAVSRETDDKIKTAARELKKRIYGNRIVLFAPLYIGNNCTNNCLYCGFRASNKAA